MNSKEICDLKRETFQVQIRKQHTKKKHDIFRNQLLQSLFGFNPYSPTLEQISKLVNLVIGYLENKISSVEDILPQFIEAMSKQSYNTNNFDSSIVGIFKQLFFKLEQQEIGIRNKLQQYVIIILIGLTRFKCINQEVVSRFDLVDFVIPIFKSKNNKMMGGTLMIVNQYSLLGNAKQLFLQSNSFMQTISTLTQQFTSRQIQTLKVSIVKQFIIWWQNVPLSQYYCSLPNTPDGDTIIAIYKLAFQVISNHSDYLYQNDKDPDETYIVMALGILNLFTSQFAQQLLDFTNGKQHQLHPNILCNLLMNSNIQQGKQIVAYIVYNLVNKSQKFCRSLVEDTNYVTLITSKMKNNLLNVVVATLHNIIAINGKADQLVDAIHSMCMFCVNDELVNHDQKQNILDLVIMWFCSNSKTKNELKYSDIKFLKMLSLSTEYINQYKQNELWKLALKRGYDGPLPVYINLIDIDQ